MEQNPQIRNEILEIQERTSPYTLGALLGYIAQRMHTYIPLIDKIEKETHPNHIDAKKFKSLKTLLENFIHSCPVVSKIGISKLLEITKNVESNQVIKIPGDIPRSIRSLHKELIAEGVIWQIDIVGDKEVRRKCYLILFVNRIICIPFEKKETFKASYVGDDISGVENEANSTENYDPTNW